MATYLAPGVYVKEQPSAVRPIAGVGTSTAAFIGVVPDTVTVPVEANPAFDATKPPSTENPASINEPVKLAAAAGRGPPVHELRRVHAHVRRLLDRQRAIATSRTRSMASSTTAARAASWCARRAAAPIGDVRWRARPRSTRSRSSPRPGIVDDAVRAAIVDPLREDRRPLRHPRQPGSAGPTRHAQPDARLDKTGVVPAELSDFAAVYFPWIQVFDPATKLATPAATASIYVPPSGHVAGVYARVDDERGVHKAPANEVVLGALDVQYHDQQGAAGRPQPAGRQRIRDAQRQHPRLGRAHRRRRRATASGSTSTCGGCCCSCASRSTRARSGSSSSPTTRRCGPKITRNVTAFLTNVWRDGRAVRRHAGRSVLRQVRRGDQPARGARARPGRHRDRRRHRPAGGVRDLPHQPVARRRPQLEAGRDADADLPTPGSTAGDVFLERRRRRARDTACRRSSGTPGDASRERARRSSTRVGASSRRCSATPPGSYLADAVRGLLRERRRAVLRRRRRCRQPASGRAGRRWQRARAGRGRPGVTIRPRVASADATCRATPTPRRAALQRRVLEHCDARGDRFAILDSLPARRRPACSRSGSAWQLGQAGR